MKIAVLGAGPGGYVAAIRAVQLGAEVTVIESTEVGGTCLNRGCIPTKSILASSEMLAKSRDIGSFGIELEGRITPNMRRIIERKNRIISLQVKGIRSLFKSWKIRLIEGHGSFSSPGEIRVRLKDGGDEVVSADAFIIATGSRPARIPTLPFDGMNIISSTEALELNEIPESLLIVGAGVIGCEFACIYGDLGTDVTIVELMDRAVSTEDESISRLLERELKKKKIKLMTGTAVERAEIRADGVHTFLSCGQEIITEKVLVSVGRSFNTEGLGLENAGVQTGKRNEITVNTRMQTNVSNFYAIGDVTGGLLLAHVASKQGMIAAGNIMGGNDSFDRWYVPAAIFTSPEVASVGLREHEAKERGLNYTIGEFPFRGLGRAHAIGEISGFTKVIADESGRILGAHIIGPHASELIHEFVIAMQGGLTVTEIAETIHAHPTLSEVLMEASEDIRGLAIHLPRKQG